MNTSSNTAKSSNGLTQPAQNTSAQAASINSFIDLVPDHLKSLVPYKPGKPIEEVMTEYGLKKVYKLASNENPWGPSPLAQETYRQQLDQMHLYPDATASELKNALASFYGRLPSELVLGNGSDEIIDMLTRSLTSPEEKILTSEKSFDAYTVRAAVHNRKMVYVPMLNDFRYDLAAMEKALQSDKNIRLVFLANPNNPTGTVCFSRQVKHFLERAQALKVWVVVDEAYFEFGSYQSSQGEKTSDEGSYESAISLGGQFANLIVLRTFSKNYGLASMRVGFAFMDKTLAELINRTRLPFNVGAASQKAAIAALKDQEHLLKTLKNNCLEMKYLISELKVLGWDVNPSYTNFLWLPLPSGFKWSALGLFEKLLQKGIIVRPFTYGNENYLRVSIGLSLQNKAFITALQSILKEA